MKCRPRFMTLGAWESSELKNTNVQNIVEILFHQIF